MIEYAPWRGSFNDVLSYTTFRFRFSRPRLRVDWWSDHPYPLPRGSGFHNVIWFDGGAAVVRFLGRQESVANLSLAIGGATGVTGGFVRTVPPLLIPELGYRVTELREPVLLGEELYAGRPCHVLKGVDPGGAARQLWIGKSDSLLWKQRQWVDGFVRDELHRGIQVDRAVAFEPLPEGFRARIDGILLVGCVLLVSALLALYRGAPLVVGRLWIVVGVAGSFLAPSLVANLRWLLVEGGAYRDVSALFAMATALPILAAFALLRGEVAVGSTVAQRWLLMTLGLSLILSSLR